MATKQQKQELIDTLKFTPVRVRLLIQGYGGEAYAGKVDRKIYDYFAKNKFDIEEYATAWDDQFDVPSDLQPFPAGAPFECDDLFHASGAELSELNEIRIENADTGDTIWVHNMGWGDLEDSGVTVDQFSDVDFEDIKEGEVVFWGGQGEKGCFFDAEFELKAPFDPKKLVIKFETCDGWHIVNYVEYNEEDLDGTGGYSTTGKWAESKWVLGGDEEVYESVSIEDREEEESDDDWDPAAELDKIIPPYTVTDWFEKTVKPAHKGEYEVMIDAPWPNGGLGRADWNGRGWKHNGEKVKIHQWRGITEDLG
jgi:hypothetical protein